MEIHALTMPERIVAALRSKLFGRYASVSAASVITGHVLLYGLHSVLGINPVPSNLLSTAGNTALVLLASRRWIWGVAGKISIRGEVMPFAGLACLGLALSTLLVWITAEVIGEGLWVNAANLTAFGIVWLARFWVLDKWIYRQVAASP